jgi:polar amino acid transport system substrate-binding protein
MGLAWRWILILGAASLAGGARADERLAVGAEFSRVFEQAPDGQWSGLGVDVVRALALQAGDTVRFKMVPWPRAQAMVALGQADILVGPYKSPERLRQFAFVDHPFYRDRMVFYGLRTSPGGWTGQYAALKDVPIAVVRGWHYGAAFDHARPGLRVSVVPRLENGALMLANGRVALLAANRRNIEPVLAALHMADTVTEVGPVLAVQDGYLAFPLQPRFAPLRARYNELFTQMVHKGELARLGRKNDVQVP